MDQDCTHHRDPYLDLVAEKVVIFDGATGTWLQEQDLTADDFGGEEFEGCNDILVDTRPELIAQMHREYLEAGADVVETNSFGAFAVPLGEYGIARPCPGTVRKCRRGGPARRGRVLHRRIVPVSWPARWVPAPSSPRSGQIRYRRAARHVRGPGRRAARGWRRPLHHRDPVRPARTQGRHQRLSRAAMAEVGREVPIQAQVTIELTGRMLPGTEIGAALVALDAMGPDVIGINCATGPRR